MASASSTALPGLSSSGVAEKSGRGLFARLTATIQESRMRHAEREIGRLIEIRGGRLTDDIERQIERSFV